MNVLNVNAGTAIILACLSSAVASVRADDVAAQIDQANKRFAAAVAKGDADQVADMYATDGKLLPPNSDVVTGRKDIRAFWSKAMESGIKSVTLTASEVEAHENT